MKTFRLLVLIGCFSAAIILLFAAKSAQTGDGVFFLVPGALFALAAIYLLIAPNPDSRIGRIVGLWLDAKEAELKRRANPEG
jgi:hypothetical protein